MAIVPRPPSGSRGLVARSEGIALMGGSVGVPSASGSMSTRYQYPRSRILGASGSSVTERTRSSSHPPQEENFDKFRGRTAPMKEEIKENIFDKASIDPFRHDARFMASHISLAAPEDKLELTLKDRRSRPLPSALRPAALDILERPLRCLDRAGKAPAGHPSDEFYNMQAARAPPQPIPAVTQKLESEFVDTIEKSLRDGEDDAGLWEQYAKRAEELLITMPLEKMLRALKAFVLAKYRGGGLYTHIGGELAKEVRNASSARICQIFHWLGRAGLRDQTLMSLIGNEALLRLSDDFVLDMHVEVLNAHAKLDIRNPRLVTAILRDLSPLFHEIGRDQCSAVSPLAVMTVFSDQAKIAYLTRCAELNLALPVHMTRPALLRQFRLLEDCLRLDYHPIVLPNNVQVWLANLKAEADEHDVVDATSLSPVEEDILRVLREEMDVAVTPAIQDGIFSLHLCMGKTCIEVLDAYEDYYITPAMGGQRLLRADTKLRQRLLWRRGWRLLTMDEEDWTKLTDDLYKKDLLEDLLVNGSRKYKVP